MESDDEVLAFTNVGKFAAMYCKKTMGVVVTAISYIIMVGKTADHTDCNATTNCTVSGIVIDNHHISFSSTTADTIGCTLAMQLVVTLVKREATMKT